MLQFLDRALLIIHIFFAFGSLVIFWIPVFTKMGGKAHRTTGKAYVISMWVTVCTAFILSIINLYEGDIFGAAFLGFLSIISANPLWYGIAILKHKNGLGKSYNQKQMYFNIIITLTGVTLLLTGLYIGVDQGGVLMIIFGVLGLTTGITVIKELKTPPVEANWLFMHLKGMITSGIACYTAFFAFGGRTFFEKFLTGYWSVLPWVAPTIIGLIIIRVMKRRYTIKS